MAKLIENGSKVVPYPMSGYLLEIGKYEDFEKVQRDIKHIKF
jgi:NDP-sugar pyrophosphorylase family protein